MKQPPKPTQTMRDYAEIANWGVTTRPHRSLRKKRQWLAVAVGFNNGTKVRGSWDAFGPNREEAERRVREKACCDVKLAVDGVTAYDNLVETKIVKDICPC